MSTGPKGKQCKGCSIQTRILAVQAIEHGIETALLEVNTALSIEKFGPCHKELITIRDSLTDIKTKVTAIVGVMKDVEHEVNSDTSIR